MFQTGQHEFITGAQLTDAELGRLTEFREGARSWRITECSKQDYLQSDRTLEVSQGVQGVGHRDPLLLMFSPTNQNVQSVEDRYFRRTDELWKFLSVGLGERGFVLCLPYGKTERE